MTLTLDLDHSQAWLNPGGNLTSIDADVGYGPSTPGGTNGSSIGIVLPQGHNLPYPTGYGPAATPRLFVNNGLIGSHVLPIVADTAPRSGATAAHRHRLDGDGLA